MVPNKFEKHIKEQLKQREMRPSEDAWQQLSKKLDAIPAAEEKSFSWYAVAACAVGLLIASAWYFNDADTNAVRVNPTVDMVDVNVETEKINGDTLQSMHKAVPFQESNELVVSAAEIEVPRALELKSSTENKGPELQNQMVLAEEFKVPPAEKEKEVLVTNSLEEEVINTKILEIVAVVDSLERNNAQITDAEVDALLRHAQDEILKEKLFNKKGALDAMALLTSVEDELDQSFRDQIFESLKSGFLKVRTAVADRNN